MSSGSQRFASMAIPAYRALWWSGSFSFIAVQMQFLLRGLLAWDLTEAEGSLGLVYFAFGLSLGVATPLGGVAADRLPQRRLMIVGQATLSIAAFAMGAAVIADVAQFWMLLAAGSVQGLMFGLIGPARIAFTTSVVGRDLVGNAVTLQALSLSATRVFAPALAGVLASIALVGIGGAYMLSATCSAVSTMLLLPLPNIEARPSGPSATKNPLRDIVEGVAYVARSPFLRPLILTSTVVVSLGFNYVAFMTPLVEDTFGLEERFVGFAIAASAVGAVAVSVPLAGRADGSGARHLLALCGLGFGVGILLLSGAPSYLVALGVVVLIGGCSTGFLALAQSQALRATDDAHQGRVQSLVQISFAGFGIMAYPLGALAERIGLRTMLFLMGVAMAATVVLFALAGIRRQRATDAAELAAAAGA